MNLPSQHLVEKATADSQGECDARRAARLRISLPIAYTMNLPHIQVNGAAHTINVSGGGVQLSVSGSVSPLTPCEVTLHLPDHASPLTFQGYVKWCKPARGKRALVCKIGVAFAKPAPHEESAFSQFCHFIATRLFTKHLRLF